MRRFIIITIATLAGICAICVGWFITQMPPSPRMPQPVEDPAPTPEAENPTKGNYQDYSAEVVAATDGTRLLFFHASWCPQCRALDADIRQQEIPTGVTIFKVDYDSHQALRQKYGVTIQTTVVKIDEGGNLVKKYVAYDEPTLAKVKENLLWRSSSFRFWLEY